MSAGLWQLLAYSQPIYPTHIHTNRQSISQKSRYIKRKHNSRPKTSHKKPQQTKKKVNTKNKCPNINLKMTRLEKNQKKWDRKRPILRKYNPMPSNFENFDKIRKNIILVNNRNRRIFKQAGTTLIECWHRNKLQCRMPRDILKILCWLILKPDMNCTHYYWYCGPLKAPRVYYKICCGCRKSVVNPELYDVLKRQKEYTPYGYPLAIQYCKDCTQLYLKQKKILGNISLKNS